LLRGYGVGFLFADYQRKALRGYHIPSGLGVDPPIAQDAMIFILPSVSKKVVSFLMLIGDSVKWE
tara:strand:- start:340 stop:534 length:195 start_codon:yes stop_codon:yes gene_type:complete